MVTVRGHVESYIQSDDENDLRQALNAINAVRRTGRFITVRLSGSLRPLRALFLGPVDGVEAVLKCKIKVDIINGFRKQVCDEFNRTIAGKYPFVRVAEDALLEDVIDFITPSSPLWSYYDKHLKPHLHRSGDIFISRTRNGRVPAGIIAFLNQALKVQKIFLGRGGDRLRTTRFDLEIFGADNIPIVLDICGKKVFSGVLESNRGTFEWPCRNNHVALNEIFQGETLEWQSYEGDWALLRLIDSAKIKKFRAWHELQWKAPYSGKKVTIRIRPTRSVSPLFSRAQLACG